MSERRCPNCGALVAADAEWCSQCFHSFAARAAAPEVPPPPPGAADAGGTPATGDQAAAAAPPPPVPVAPGGTTVPVTGTSGQEQPTWTCPSCGEVNLLEDNACSVCGTPFFALFQQADERPDVVPRDAILRSLLFPGLGHSMLGRTGDGVARGVLFAWTLGTALLVLLSRGDRSLGPLLGIVALFVVFALVVYVGTAVEAARIAEGGAPFLSPRGLAWASAGLVIVTLGLAFVLITGSSDAREEVPAVVPGEPAQPPPTIVLPTPSPTTTLEPTPTTPVTPTAGASEAL
ncbi:MAG: Ran-binding zinc finger domain-containing protein [Actinomycetota bacterium]